MYVGLFWVVLWVARSRPLYFWYKKIGRKTPDKDEVDAKDYDIIPENQHYTQSDRNWRSIISFIIFIILLAVQGGITFGLSFIGRDSSGTGTNFMFVVHSQFPPSENAICGLLADTHIIHILQHLHYIHRLLADLEFHLEEIGVLFDQL